MIFQTTPLEGVFVIEVEPAEDERGFFARIYCQQEFAQRGLISQFSQSSLSFNKRRGTVRGMHFQEAPSAETKTVRVIRGAIFDVAIDVRPQSPTRGEWTSVELTQDNRKSLYIPEGFAHGFQTLSDDTEVLYQISSDYDATLARGFRWNDPAFGISWPLEASVISPRDLSYADYER
ncbi:dTDP-4-dehydrorhamnose 3,5-epimerase [Rosistilla ulvae]|uniref:dTDP-4-dehydrorhamnose 3,5-epimerase n=1 Tax=Rosistilla ulvae TaxID=1930277 RepID=A0A517LYQ4_9BACT|nr:dTDP-4-dehydrorhamnose 3,5-epimerase [Rosistilla ulvae]QDS87753.1 dTDP-4-dehydrorhamnose 3,5-epimerase [Rosistilla ulvae]